MLCNIAKSAIKYGKQFIMVSDYSLIIKELRKKMNLSQEEFAKVLGVSFSSINRWENDHHEPTIKSKKKLKALFKEYEIR